MRRAVSDGGVNGRPVVTLVVRGFVLGRVSREAEVDIYHLPSASGQGAPQVKGADVSTSSSAGTACPARGTAAATSASAPCGGFYRVVVRGSGVYLFAGGRGKVWLRGSSADPKADGTYSVDGSSVRSMPTQLLKRKIGRG